MLLAGWYSVVALTVLQTIGFAAVATADQIQPSKIRTVKITEGAKPAPDAHVVQTAPVRPASDEPHNASSKWSGTPGLVSATSNPHHIRSLTIRSEHPDADPRYRRFAPEALEPTQAAPQ
ncbi:hypothetical protein [Bradyrhizobium viridifuturi]|uniref:hypothetical protein n=1 Tax=Bradyrhizobium viridifuturi TaxID=1654716 RepID=UPI00067F3DEE|nr:hypothetical protein [Bradyrhizobium viridifuturi]